MHLRLGDSRPHAHGNALCLTRWVSPCAKAHGAVTAHSHPLPVPRSIRVGYARVSVLCCAALTLCLCLYGLHRQMGCRVFFDPGGPEEAHFSNRPSLAWRKCRNCHASSNILVCDEWNVHRKSLQAFLSEECQLFF